MKQLNIVVIGLSISSSWGNGHATTYRALLKQLHKDGDMISFLEWDAPWYAANRDLPDPDFCDLIFYSSIEELKAAYAEKITCAGVVIIGSYVKDGVEIAEWAFELSNGIVAFYDIDTPITICKMKKGDFEYIHPSQIEKYDLYLSFTGGKILHVLEDKYNSPSAKALYCSVDIEEYYPLNKQKEYDLGYLGTYSEDRQPALESLMIEAARNWKRGFFVAAGPQYPEDINWPVNLERIEHLPPSEHNEFYNSLRFTLNVTRADMIKAGWSPSVRLFEAAAAGVPIISDYWEGLDEIYNINSEILIADSTAAVLRYLREMDDKKRNDIIESALKRTLAEHTSSVRAEQLKNYLIASLNKKSSRKAAIS
jgi:spore maturation protein CgeB